MTGDEDPTTQELRAVQSELEEREREAAQDAPTDEAERAHRRRADKAAYLQDKLTEQERAEEEGEGKG